VNTPEDLDLCVSLGVEAVITDYPQRTLKQLTPPASFGRGA